MAFNGKSRLSWSFERVRFRRGNNLVNIGLFSGGAFIRYFGRVWARAGKFAKKRGEILTSLNGPA